MNRNILKFFDRAIEFLFYALFFLVPIVFAGTTSELFEFNKMWITFGVTALVAFFWIGKMVIKKEFRIQRTPLDIPIFLFLLSQIISTIFSMDTHISLWGYYSRFNGGLLSFISYIFLYYAFVSNFLSRPTDKNKRLDLKEMFDQKIVRRVLLVSVFAGVFVALWGLPSHFGYDPTCKIFRGTFDVSCWTVDFQPKIRIFSTMGQPDWLAAYLVILLPISLAFCLNLFDKAKSIASKTNLFSILFGLISVLFYVDLLFTRARSGVIAFWVSMLIFAGFIFLRSAKNKVRLKNILLSRISLFLIIFVAITFFLGSSIGFIDKFGFQALKDKMSKSPVKQAQVNPLPAAGELGGTDSGKIRLIVWKGALNVWKNNPIFGTGVETFAFAYYKYRPPEHNLTSEWNFLYNKAHNEFLNFMATTGTFGIVTYLIVLIGFLWIVTAATFEKVNKKSSFVLSRIKSTSFPLYKENSLLIAALTSSFISIMVTNFFGFSVVITNIYLLLIPAFAFILLGNLNFDYSLGKENLGSQKIGKAQWIALVVIAIPSILAISFLVNSWNADTQYALGDHYNSAGQYQQAYPLFHKAVQMRSDEPVFKDSMSVNDAVLATLLLTQGDPKDKQQNQAIAQTLAQEAVATNNDLTTNYPNNLIFWKSKVRIYYTLAQVSSSYLPLALQAVQKASELAPTDASIQYNLGVLTGQNGDSKKAVDILNYTVSIKSNYTEARYALGLFLRDLAVDKKTNQVVNQADEAKAEEQMRYILKYLNPEYPQAKDSLSAWTGQSK